MADPFKRAFHSKKSHNKGSTLCEKNTDAFNSYKSWQSSNYYFLNSSTPSSVARGVWKRGKEEKDVSKT